jgi:hypothetical protein
MTNVLLILGDAPKTDDYDISDKVGQLHGKDCWGNDPEWPMYSYDRPAYILWNAIAKNLHKRGWSDTKIKKFLQSKDTRWALDMGLGEALQNLGDEFATKFIGKDGLR